MDTKLSIWGDSTVSVERPSSIWIENVMPLLSPLHELYSLLQKILWKPVEHTVSLLNILVSVKTVTWTEKRNRICFNQERREHFSESYQPPLLKVGHSGAWRVIVLSVLSRQAGFYPCGSSHLFSWWCDNKGGQHQPTNKESKISVCAHARVLCAHVNVLNVRVRGY